MKQCTIRGQAGVGAQSQPRELADIRWPELLREDGRNAPHGWTVKPRVPQRWHSRGHSAFMGCPDSGVSLPERAARARVVHSKVQ